ncbi:MAG TPA: hypothetical protein VG895_05235 [Patescibacteria group bacterium]|nr:hypothetical protein [Patescibacteria group bacterium]
MPEIKEGIIKQIAPGFQEAARLNKTEKLKNPSKQVSNEKPDYLKHPTPTPVWFEDPDKY